MKKTFIITKLVNRKDIYEKVFFCKLAFFRNSRTSEVILNKIKKLCLYNVGIHINFHQNPFINEYSKKIL